MNNEILDALSQITREKSVDRALLIETLEQGLASAVRKKHGATADVDVKFAPESKILLAAFNKRIADELNTRLPGSNPNAVAKTLHAATSTSGPEPVLASFSSWAEESAWIAARKATAETANSAAASISIASAPEAANVARTARRLRDGFMMISFCGLIQ